MGFAYYVGLLSLPIVVALVGAFMRIINRSRPLKPNHYIIIWVVYVVIIGINMLMPLEEKVVAFILAAIILGLGYLFDKALKVS